MPRINIEGFGPVDVTPEFLQLPAEQQNAMIQQICRIALRAIVAGHP